MNEMEHSGELVDPSRATAWEQKTNEEVIADIKALRDKVLKLDRIDRKTRIHLLLELAAIAMVPSESVVTNRTMDLISFDEYKLIPYNPNRKSKGEKAIQRSQWKQQMKRHNR